MTHGYEVLCVLGHVQDSSIVDDVTLARILCAALVPKACQEVILRPRIKRVLAEHLPLGFPEVMGAEYALRAGIRKDDLLLCRLALSELRTPSTTVFLVECLLLAALSEDQRSRTSGRKSISCARGLLTGLVAALDPAAARGVVAAAEQSAEVWLPPTHSDDRLKAYLVKQGLKWSKPTVGVNRHTVVIGRIELLNSSDDLASIAQSCACRAGLQDENPDIHNNSTFAIRRILAAFDAENPGHIHLRTANEEFFDALVRALPPVKGDT
jgi:hypothetical protein